MSRCFDSVLQMGALVLVQQILSLVLSPVDFFSLMVAILFIGIGLLVPACGYYGARDKSRSLLQWFWGCNALGACW